MPRSRRGNIPVLTVEKLGIGQETQAARVQALALEGKALASRRSL